MWWEGLVIALEDVVRILQAVIIGELIRYFSRREEERGLLWGIMLACMLSISSFIISLTHHIYFYWGYHIGMQMRGAILA